MASFMYRAVDADGAIATGTITATSHAQAVVDLKSRKLYPLDVTTASPNTPASTQLALGRLTSFRSPSAKDFVEPMRLLSTLLDAGVALPDAIRLVGRNTRYPVFYEQLVHEVTNGSKLSAALKDLTSSISADVLASIAARESIGHLAQGLKQAADTLAGRQELKSEILSLLVYPTILMVLALASFSIVLVYLVPALAPVFEGSGTSMPWIMHTVLSIRLVLVDHGYALSLTTCLTILVAVIAWQKEEPRRRIVGLMAGLPVIGPILRRSEALRFSSVLAALLEGGVALPDAMKHGQQACLASRSKAAVEAVSRKLLEGQSLSGCLADLPFIDDISRQLLTAGEKANKLPEMFGYVARLAETDLRAGTRRIMTLLPPLLTVLIGAFVGGLILSVMQALTSINAVIG